MSTQDIVDPINTEEVRQFGGNAKEGDTLLRADFDVIPSGATFLLTWCETDTLRAQQTCACPSVFQHIKF